jgi:hypothetical protein
MKIEHTVEQRVNVNFCVKLQRSSSEMLRDVKDNFWWIPRPKKPWMSKSKIKTMFICFFNKGTTVNQKFYVEVLERLSYAMWRDCLLILHHDNALVHYSLQVSQFLAWESISAGDHPSPDLVPADFWMCPKFKNALKGEHFLDIEDIKSSVKKFWNIPLQDFITCFELWLRHWEHSRDSTEVTLKYSMLLIYSALKINF